MDVYYKQVGEQLAPPVTVIKKWRKPEPGRFFVISNADMLNEGGVGLEAVVRGSNGDFVLATTKRMSGEYSVEMAEVMVAELGMQLMTGMNVGTSILESDCMSMISKMQNPHS
ncbi:unnamed protein product [Linum trigynum]|uniref:RNase H type-1 domain-containing protein n=1 Tax=Linum trigynum TaxID=586398 RepID=A0AAV2FYJ8_9ROSI